MMDLLIRAWIALTTLFVVALLCLAAREFVSDISRRFLVGRGYRPAYGP